jgi:aconitate hydratase
MQDFTGVPAGGRTRGHARRHEDPRRRSRADQPAGARDWSIDHFVTDEFGTRWRFDRNVELEYERNCERYRFLKWGQTAVANFPWCPRAPASATR